MSLADYDRKRKEAMDLAEANEVLVRDMGGFPIEWLIIGPEEFMGDMKKKLLSCFGVAQTSRRFVTPPADSDAASSRQYQPLPSFSDTTQTSITTEDTPRAYRKTTGDLSVYTWLADITKMNVDIIVNAANKDLTNGAGVFYTTDIL